MIVIIDDATQRRWFPPIIVITDSVARSGTRLERVRRAVRWWWMTRWPLWVTRLRLRRSIARARWRALVRWVRQ